MGTNSRNFLTDSTLKENKGGKGGKKQQTRLRRRIGVKENKKNRQRAKSKLLSSFERLASFLCLLSLLCVLGEAAENSYLFSFFSLTPIAEYGDQQSRVEDNPKILWRRPQTPAQKNARPQKEKFPILKPILTKQKLGARKRSNKVFKAIKIRV